ncbi:hypothetical protein B0T14DRAFT_42319 [Immersiella caudata]|uniref:Uncharacterized protein n=1 Tax=Immersiella caudata TaxID=314043 RepID=A0AA39XF17_9PEZI|nr:hypothetical protein B0T14DRAFT_42319 [Immersiella caudata]
MRHRVPLGHWHQWRRPVSLKGSSERREGEVSFWRAMHRAGDQTELALMHMSGDPSGRRYSNGPDAGRHAQTCLVCSSQLRTGSAGSPTPPKHCFCPLTFQDSSSPRSSQSSSSTSLGGSQSDEVQPAGPRKLGHSNLRPLEPEASAPDQLRYSTSEGAPSLSNPNRTLGCPSFLELPTLAGGTIDQPRGGPGSILPNTVQLHGIPVSCLSSQGLRCGETSCRT